MVEDRVFEPIPGLPDWRVSHVASTGSTSADLITLVSAGKAGEGRLWLTAGEQTAGRGRRNRRWSSPVGNLHTSLALLDPAPTAHIGFLPLVAALAIRDAIDDELDGTDATVALKWPNDVLINGAKCCGTLLETATTPDNRPAVIIGCGINISAHPLDTPYPATHLRDHQPSADARSLFHRLAASFAATLADWDRGRNGSALRDRWLEHALGRGEPLTVRLDNAIVQGVFEDLDEAGLLILRMSDGASRRFAAGDVFFN